MKSDSGKKAPKLVLPTNKNIIVVVSPFGNVQVFPTFVMCCDYFKLPYHSLKSNSFPFTFELGSSTGALGIYKMTVNKVQMYRYAV